MAQLFANNLSFLPTGDFGAGATDLYLTLQSGTVPTVTGGDTLLITFGEGDAAEIIEVTSTSDLTGGDWYMASCVRAREGTTAAAWTTADLCSARVTSATMDAAVAVAGAVGVLEAWTVPAFAQTNKTVTMDQAALVTTIESTGTAYVVTLQQPSDTTLAYVRYVQFSPMGGPVSPPTFTAGTGTIKAAGTGFVEAKEGLCKITGSVDYLDNYIYFLEFTNQA